MPNNNEGTEGKNLLRVFIAIDMPAVVKNEIRKIQGELKKHDLFRGTYVDPEHAHLTLQFIGYVEPLALGPIKKLLESIAFSPIHARLDGVGAFENKMFIKVVWVNIEGQGIVELAHAIEKVLSLGTVARKRPFQSHVTLARVKQIDDVEALRKLLTTITVEPVSFTIDEFVLKQSTLTEQGPIYVDLETYEAD